MGKVFTHMTMSLDGFIADPNDQVGELFDWYEAGDVTVPTPNEEISFQVDDASAQMLRELTGNTGALVSGRHLFDIANGWGDNHPAGAPVVVVTHRAPEDAAKRYASDRGANRIFLHDRYERVRMIALRDSRSGSRR